MMQTPIIKPNIMPFDAKEDYVLEFYADNERQINKNQLIIEDEIGNEVYNKTIRSYVYTHTIPANTLVNGKNYKAKVKVSSANDVWSDFSPYEIFRCLSPADITITTIDYDNGNKVYNQNVTFEAEYNQPEGEKPSVYRFKLYDKSGVLFKSYDERVYKGSIEEYITDLEDSEDYYIEVVVRNNAGRIDSSGKIAFVPKYEITSLSAVLDPVNSAKDGAVELRARLSQIKGKLYDDNGELIAEEDIDYVNEEFLDLTRDDYDLLVYDEGFNFSDKSFTLKLWLCNPIESTPNDDRPLLKMLDTDKNTLSLYYYNNKFHIFKTRDKTNIHYTHIGKINSSCSVLKITSNKGHIDIQNSKYDAKGEF